MKPAVLRFAKMHGLGNDYIYVDCFDQPYAGHDWPAICRAISDRNRGVGSDGLILICPPQGGAPADVRMEMYNADGSRGEMCGNGIRCVAKYAVRTGRAGPASNHPTRIRVQTDCGTSAIDVQDACNRMAHVRVDMGAPTLIPKEIPVDLPGDSCVRAPFEVDGKRFSMTAVSMGNPHAVFFVADVAAIDLARLGPIVERHRLFPRRVNAHFVQIANSGEATMRTWERGAGATQACGSGACAVLVAGILEGRLNRSATLHLPGGDLRIEWPEDAASVFMTGPAEEVCTGEWPMV